jgi:ketosteroid isomerase-like protein
MSKENLDLVRRSWDAWSRGDVDEGLSCYSVDAEWDMSTFSGWPEQQLFRGHEEIREFLERWRGAWDNYEAGVDEFLGAGDKVCVLCWQRGRGKEAGVQVEMMAYAHLLTVRDGKITRAELHSDRQKALEAAGLSEEDVRADTGP